MGTLEGVWIRILKTAFQDDDGVGFPHHLCSLEEIVNSDGCHSGLSTPLVLCMDDERIFGQLVTKHLALSTWVFVFEIWFSGSFLPAVVIWPLDNKTFKS